MIDILDQALALAANGIPVFFCRDNKRPATPHGFHDATTDPNQLREMFRRYPGPLIAIATGAASGMDVLDLDLQHKTADDWWRANQTKMPTTRMHQTPSGGLHLFFLHVPGLRGSVSR